MKILIWVLFSFGAPYPPFLNHCHVPVELNSQSGNASVTMGPYRTCARRKSEHNMDYVTIRTAILAAGARLRLT